MTAGNGRHIRKRVVISGKELSHPEKIRHCGGSSFFHIPVSMCISFLPLRPD